MKKSKLFLSRMLAMAMVLVFGMTSVGCATTQHGVEITNVRNIREINIRNAGTTSWGPNLVRNLDNIDRSMFSETVDIRVVDTNGIVFSRNNVPFGDDAFELTGRESTPNGPVFGLLGLAAIIAAFVVWGGE